NGGLWEFSTDGGATWTGFGNPKTNAARLLSDASGNRIRWNPNADFNGTATFTCRAWDRTTGTDGSSADTTVNGGTSTSSTVGTNGSTADTSINGGTSTFSSATRNATITVLPVNAAPTLNAIADPAAILEDATLQTINLAGITAGPNGTGQTLTITATSSNT